MSECAGEAGSCSRLSPVSYTHLLIRPLLTSVQTPSLRTWTPRVLNQPPLFFISPVVYSMVLKRQILLKL